MLETLRLLRLEIDALILLVGAGPTNLSANSPLAQRIQSLLVTWSLNVKPLLLAAGIPFEVVARAESAVTALGRLTAVDTLSQKYSRLLRLFRLVITKQVLLEVAKLPLATRLDADVSSPQKLLPQIYGLPNEFIPNPLIGWTPQMRAFLKSHSFDRNVFVMISYRKKLVPLLERVKKALVDIELDPIVAKDHAITDDLYNPIACLLC